MENRENTDPATLVSTIAKPRMINSLLISFGTHSCLKWVVTCSRVTILPALCQSKNLKLHIFTNKIKRMAATY